MRAVRFASANRITLLRDADGVLFEIHGGTIDYGKVALRFGLTGAQRD